jgi:hypothetical protein
MLVGTFETAGTKKFKGTIHIDVCTSAKYMFIMEIRFAQQQNFC